MLMLLSHVSWSKGFRNEPQNLIFRDPVPNHYFFYLVERNLAHITFNLSWITAFGAIFVRKLFLYNGLQLIFEAFLRYLLIWRG
jgi:hypothetical protein